MEESWNSFDAVMLAEESELMAQLLGAYPFGHELNLASPSMYWSDHVDNSYCSSQDVDSTFCKWPQVINNNIIGTTSFFAPTYESNVVPSISADPDAMIFGTAQEDMVDPNCFGDRIGFLKNDELADSGSNPSEPVICRDQFGIGEPTECDRKLDTPAASPKKKAKTSTEVQKNDKNPKPKKAKKSIRSDEEDMDNVVAPNTQSSGCHNSERDCNASQEPSCSTKGNVALNLSGKTRASRGSATDPQSLYARKRRERINERLRILQSLVPNGTKVDISTMLEEAVQYVKFLQLQIKLLSSDETWMYAPLAYNGMDIGLDLKISPRKQ